MRRHFAAALLALGLACSYPGGPRTVVYENESYLGWPETGYRQPSDGLPSTFSIDVDTASYSNSRRFLEAGERPPKEAVRVEEMLNYFAYDYPEPEEGRPFSISSELSDCPWNVEHQLLRLGLQGRHIQPASIPPRNLVFLVDVSGSMSESNKLPLLQESLRLLVQKLDRRDRVGIVVYAGREGVALPSTPGDEHEAIEAAIARLSAKGSTNGGAGIKLAYHQARQNFHPDAINRVILATDGDFNVGITDRHALERIIEKERESGIFLTVLGMGRGNIKDATMEQLADKGNGNYAYIDSLEEAEKVLVREAGASLTLAKDVKLHVEFNPARVASYRLVGYENRRLANKDFDDDQADAGELGAGQSVTALYELVPAEPSKEQLAEVKVRYKLPDQNESLMLKVSLPGTPQLFEQASTDHRFAAAVAAFGLVLSESKYKGSAELEGVADWAADAIGQDESGDRRGFLQLVGLARSTGTRAD